jgi:hypothetical protein
VKKAKKNIALGGWSRQRPDSSEMIARFTKKLSGFRILAITNANSLIARNKTKGRNLLNKDACPDGDFPLASQKYDFRQASSIILENIAIRSPTFRPSASAKRKEFKVEDEGKGSTINLDR